jgi:hypothetical protein
VRTKTHKLTVDLHSGAGELYDLTNDPKEMDNIFDSSAKKSELMDMIRSRPKDIAPRKAQVGMA